MSHRVYPINDIHGTRTSSSCWSSSPGSPFSPMLLPPLLRRPALPCATGWARSSSRSRRRSLKNAGRVVALPSSRPEAWSVERAPKQAQRRRDRTIGVTAPRPPLCRGLGEEGWGRSANQSVGRSAPPQQACSPAPAMERAGAHTRRCYRLVGKRRSAKGKTASGHPSQTNAQRAVQ